MGRPRLVRDAVASVFGQDWKDYELILSNNGANEDVKKFSSRFNGRDNFRYFEFQSVLPMDEHWEYLSQASRGDFQIVLTDRMVFRKGALSTIAQIHRGNPQNSNIVSWAWDLFDEQSGWFQRYPISDAMAAVKSSEETLREQFVLNRYPYELPRGLNSSVSTELVSKIRRKLGKAFSKVNPDYTYAYRCLAEEDGFVHLKDSLMISQGLSQSNGGNNYVQDVRRWLPNLNEFLSLVPSKAPLVENSIYQDFLSVMKETNNTELLDSYDRVLYYRRCFNEVSAKRNAGHMSAEDVKELEDLVRIALKEEHSDIQDEVEQEIEKSEQARLARMSLEISNQGREKRWYAAENRSAFLPDATERFSSVLTAAGFAPCLRIRQRITDPFRRVL